MALLERLYVLARVGNHRPPRRAADIAPAQLSIDDMYDGMLESLAEIMDDYLAFVPQKFLQSFSEPDEKVKIDIFLKFHSAPVVYVSGRYVPDNQYECITI
jgi:hypothetical protein